MRSINEFLLSLFFLILLSNNLYCQNDGSLDLTFGGTGMVISDEGWGRSVDIQNDGKIIVAGYKSNGLNSDFSVIRFNIDGTVDNSFGNNGRVSFAFGNSLDRAYSVKVQGNGKILVAGCSNVNAGNVFSLARLNSDGTFDENFGQNGLVMTEFVNVNYAGPARIALQANEKIILAGSARTDTTIIGNFALVRYNIDGSLDSTFGNAGKIATSLGNNVELFSMVVQADDKIVICGLSNNYNDFVLIRYNSEGSMDSTFGNAGVVLTPMQSCEYPSIAIRSDGKIFLSGTTYYMHKNTFVLIRYNTDGSIDSSFGDSGKVLTNVGMDNDYSSKIVLQSDNKIIVTGYFVAQAVTNIAIIRYIESGTLDNSFGINGIVTTGSGTNSIYDFDAIIKNDGKIVVVGDIYDTIGHSNIIVLRYNSTSLGVEKLSQKVPFTFYPDPLTSTSCLVLNNNTKDAEVTIFDITGKEIINRNFSGFRMEINKRYLGNGMYFLRVNLEGKTYIQKFTVQ